MKWLMMLVTVMCCGCRWCGADFDRVKYMSGEWVPRSTDSLFAHNMINMINDQGVWAVPMSNQVYQFDHRNKVMTLIEGPDTEVARDIFRKNAIVFGQCGYQVVDGRTKGEVNVSE